MIGHFPEGEQVVGILLDCRKRGLGFEDAWLLAIHRVRRGRLDTNPRWWDTFVGLDFAKPAFRRSYEGLPVERQDVVATALLHAMEGMYDDSQDAEPTGMLEAA